MAKMRIINILINNMNAETYQFALAVAGVIISGLVVFSFYVLQVYVNDNKQFKKDQNTQNEKFYNLINATNLTLVKLNESIEADRRVCDERHKGK
jgi:hypothetical protein